MCLNEVYIKPVFYGKSMANIDLNLIVIFDAIMQEQSITLAAQRLSLTLPSVSNALLRMGHVWKDPLFIKHGRGIRPTSCAQKLWKNIEQPLHKMRSATDLQSFNIKKIQRTFRIASTDWMADLFWLPLRQIIEQQAPGINIHAVPYKVDGARLLLEADVDMVLDYFEGNSERINSQLLFDNHVVCAMRAHHPLASTPLDLTNFAQAEHLVMSLPGEANGSVDSILKKKGLSRRISMTENHCDNLPKILESTDLITCIPLPIILNSVKSGKLIVRKLPFSIQPGPISMSWHSQNDRDPALLWLREKILEILNTTFLPSLEKLSEHEHLPR
jgi:DNA-binding transcriptional LysR family regulator